VLCCRFVSACRFLCWKRRSLNVVSSASFDAVILAGFNWWASFFPDVVFLFRVSIRKSLFLSSVSFTLGIDFLLFFQNVVQGAGFRKNRCTPVWRKRCCQV
jgi:hypothetical protein